MLCCNRRVSKKSSTVQTVSNFYNVPISDGDKKKAPYRPILSAPGVFTGEGVLVGHSREILGSRKVFLMRTKVPKWSLFTPLDDHRDPKAERAFYLQTKQHAFSFPMGYRASFRFGV